MVFLRVAFLHRFYCIIRKLQYLFMSVKSSMVKTCPSTSIRYINICEVGYQRFCTSDSVISGSNMERCLPILIPGINISLVFQQCIDCVLQKSQRTSHYKAQIFLVFSGKLGDSFPNFEKKSRSSKKNVFSCFEDWLSLVLYR